MKRTYQPKRDRETRCTDSERECPRSRDGTCSKDAETRAERNFPIKDKHPDGKGRSTDSVNAAYSLLSVFS